MTNLLKNTRTYLVGPMDRSLDNGRGWRDDLTPFLKELGVIPLNPCEKPTKKGREDEETGKIIQQWKERGEFDKVYERMKVVRSVDLRMVDVSDFIIANVDVNIFSCGTFEEISLANREMKPILVHVVGGVKHTPNWLLGMLKPMWFFDDWDDIKIYLNNVNNGVELSEEESKRWVFFNFN